MTDPISFLPALSSTGLSSPLSGLFGATATQFGSVFDQALANAKTPADKAKLAWAQAEFSTQNMLYGMFSDPHTSFMGLGASGLFDVGGPFGLPSWTSDVERLMGNDPQVQNLMGLDRQASFLAQSRFNGGLSGLGSGSGGGFDSLF